MEMNKFTVVREVLRNNYRSHNLIGPYHFLGGYLLHYADIMYAVINSYIYVHAA